MAGRASFPARVPVRGFHATRLDIAPFPGDVYVEVDTGITYVGVGGGPGSSQGAFWRHLTRTGEVIKTVGEVVNNSDVLQDDDELLFPIEEDEVYVIDGILLVLSATNTPGLKVALTAPGSSVVELAPVGTPVAAEGNGEPITYSSVAGTWFARFTARVAATEGGSVQLQWAQASATAEDTRLLAGSHMKITKIRE